MQFDIDGIILFTDDIFTFHADIFEKGVAILFGISPCRSQKVHHFVQ